MSHIPRIPPRHSPNRGETDTRPMPPDPGPVGPAPRAEPAIMLPGPIILFLAILVLIQLGRGLLSYGEDLDVLLWLAFIPARYSDLWVGFPGGLAADAWTFVTYALLHGSWAHLITNAIWLVAFGSAVAKRFGPLRFWLFTAATAAGGAALHLATHFGENIPVVGASAAVAGLMAGACRFVFDGGGPLRMRRTGASDAAYRRPARSLLRTLSNRSALSFIAIFFALNLAIGVAGSAVGGVAIAWEAHLGGFLVGLLTFQLFDPVPR